MIGFVFGRAFVLVENRYVLYDRWSAFLVRRFTRGVLMLYPLQRFSFHLLARQFLKKLRNMQYFAQLGNAKMVLMHS